MRLDYKVRLYRNEDLLEVVKAFKEGFSQTVKSVSDLEKAHPRLLEDIVKLFILSGNVSLVAEVEGKARGILVGAFPGGFPLKKLFRVPVILSSIYSKISDLGTIMVLLEGGLELIQYSLYYSISLPSILLLTSQKNFRGRIGTELMNRWINIVRRCGYNLTIVGTDERVNWRFYEKYGFERSKSFSLRSQLPSKPRKKIDAFIYTYYNMIQE